MLLSMTACDDATETPTPKSSEIKKELMRKRMLSEAQETRPLVLQNFEMREKGELVTLNETHKNKVIALAATLCDFGDYGVNTDNDKIKKATKIKTNGLISALVQMGHTTVSIEITKGWGRNDFKQKIQFDWNGVDNQTVCKSGTF
jgi:hypothetical protein